MSLTGSQRYAFNFYVQQGYSPAQAAGIVARLSAESGPNLNPLASGDNKQAFGLAQWHPDRWSRIQQWALSQGLDPNSRETQLRAVPWEMQNHEKDAWAQLQAAQDPRAAYNAMMAYERPAGWTASTPHTGAGYQFGMNYANLLAGVTPGQPGADPGTEYKAVPGQDDRAAPPSVSAPNKTQPQKPDPFAQMGNLGLQLLAYSQRRNDQQVPWGLLGGGF